MKCKPNLLAAAFAGLLLPALAPAQILDARPVAAMPARTATAAAPSARAPGTLSWPAIRPPLGSSLITRYDEDRGQLGFTQLRFPAVNLLLDNEWLGDWRKVNTPARYALEWTSRWSPEISVGLAELPATSFPAPLDTPVWNQYLATLRQQHGTQLRLRCDDDSAVNPQMLRPLFGGRTRVLDYEIASEKPGEPVRRVLQVFMVVPRGVVVAACEGPAPIVEHFQRSFADLLMRIEAESLAEAPSLTANSATPPASARPVRGG